MQTGWQAAVGSRQVSANLHDGLARVDRTAGDTWRRQRGGGYIVSAGRIGIGKQKADGMIDKDFARHEILFLFFLLRFSNLRILLLLFLDSMSAKKKKCSNKVSMISQMKISLLTIAFDLFHSDLSFQRRNFK